MHGWFKAFPKMLSWDSLSQKGHGEKCKVLKAPPSKVLENETSKIKKLLFSEALRILGLPPFVNIPMQARLENRWHVAASFVVSHKESSFK